MATGLRTVKVRFTGDSKGLDRTAKNSQKQVGKWQGRFQKFGKAAGVGLLAAGAAAFKFGKDFIAAGEEGISVSKGLQNVFKQMGGAGSKAFKDAGKQSAALSKQIGVDQTSIEKVQTKLATFKNIWKDPVNGAKNFGRSTQIAFDLAKAGFGTADTNAVQLGKALQDPAKGMSALAESGVTFSEAEQNKIKKLQESGKLGKAQEFIYKALEKQVGGTAKAGATGADKLRAAWANFQDKVGRMLVPTFRKVTDFLTNKVLPAVSKFTDWAKDNPDKLKKIAIVIGVVLVAAFAAWAVSAAAAAIATIAATLPILAIVAGVALLIAGIFLLVKHWDKVWGFIKKTAGKVKDWIVGKWNDLIGWFKKLPGRIWGFLKKMWRPVERAATAIAKWHIKKWLQVLAWIKGLPGRIWRFLRNMWDRVKRGVIVIATFYVRQWMKVLDFIRGIPAKVRAFFARAKDWLVKAGKNIIRGLRSGVTNAMHGIKSWLKKNVWDPIVRGVKALFGIKSPSTLFAGFGKQMILGLVRGIIRTNPTKLVKKALGGVTGGLAKLFGGLFGGGGGGHGANMALGKRMAAALGWTGHQWDALRALWMGESGWRNTAQNPTSTAFGIAQFLDSTWATVGARKTSDPAGQIAAGLKYIARSYGSPANAYRKWLARSPHWYEHGTDFVPQTGPAVLHRGEMVLPEDVAEAVRQGVSGRRRFGPLVNIEQVELRDGVDIDLLAARLSFQLQAASL